MVLVAVVAGCAIAAVATAVWILRFGPFTPRAPLSSIETAIRVAIVAVASALLLVRRDAVERAALVLSVIAAGSSALCGLGVDPPAVLAVRLLSHLAAYSVWAVAAIRTLLACSGGHERPATEGCEPSP